jgi:hypothetical protein
MGGKAKVAIVAAAALALALGSVGAAAAAMSCTFKVEPPVARYGQEVVMTPSINATAYPGDKFEIQAKNTDGVWEKWGEGLAVEDTMTPGANGMTVAEPLTVLLDSSLRYPAQLRTIYLPKSSKTASATSDPTTLSMVRNTRTAVVMDISKIVKKGAKVDLNGQVDPISGVGRVHVTVQKLGGGKKYIHKYKLMTDEDGVIYASTRLPYAGRYKVQMKFMGNAFGVPSPVATTYVTVR